MEVFTFENKEGQTAGSYSTTDPQKAKDHGQKYGLKVLAQQYTWEDSELVWDLTDIEEEE